MNGVITRDDWEQSRKEAQDAHVVDHAQEQQIRMLIQAAVSLDRVTGDPDWDKFLSYVQGALEYAEELTKEVEVQLADIYLVDQTKILTLKASLALLKGQVLSLEWVLAIPKELKEQGKIAREDIGGLEKFDES